MTDPGTRHAARGTPSLSRVSRVSRANPPLKPSGRGGDFRDCLLVELAHWLEPLAGVLCHAAELRQLRRHTAHLSLVQLTDARNHLAEAVQILNPD